MLERKVLPWIAALVAALVPLTAKGQDAAPLSVELNAAAPSENGCRLSFLIQNRREAAIEQAVYETVLFDDAGQVDRLTLFDFGSLPPGRPRVRQFTLTGTTCDGIGQILFNGAETCTAPELDAGACTEGLSVGSRADIEVIG